MGFRDVAELAVGPGARVFEHGWQSWSPAGTYPAAGTSPRVSDPVRHTMGFRPGRPGPATGFQGEGLLAVDPGDGGPIAVWSAPNPSHEVPSIRARLEDDHVVISADGDIMSIRHDGHLDEALAAWAEDLASRMGVGRLRQIPPVWCSWYQYLMSVTEEDVVENLEAMDALHLPIGVVQLDDGYQSEIGDWLERSHRFPRPLTELADRIRASGKRAGIWTSPMLAGSRSSIAREHPDWLVTGADAGHNWGQPLLALDVTHPDAAGYLSHVFRTFAGWGFDYFKVDFLYAGALEGSRRDDVTAVEAYRRSIELIREAIGPDAILLGSGAPLLPSVGLFDAMRVSPDTALWYRPLDGDLSQPSQRAAVLAGRARAFQHARLWVNDPDCLIARPMVERREEWAAHIERYGGLRASSDRLADLDDWGLETTRRLLEPSSMQPLS